MIGAMVGTVDHVLYAAIAFVGLHLLLSGTPLRGLLAGALGEKAFSAAFSLVGIVTLVWLVLAYRAAPTEIIWATAPWARYLPLVVMPVALMLAVYGLSTPNPTFIGMAGRAKAKDPAPGILKITRHPFLWGVVLWALAHITVNGDSKSLILFGAMAVLALAGMLAIDAKREKSLGAAWGRLALTTSVIPFLAAAQGRTKIVWGEMSLKWAAVALVLYVVLVGGHIFFFGVTALPM
ncbi:MAG: NnrU family protein [Alphaproteobacteria bacterium]